MMSWCVTLVIRWCVTCAVEERTTRLRLEIKIEWHSKCNRLWHMTHELWHMTHELWHMTQIEWHSKCNSLYIHWECHSIWERERERERERHHKYTQSQLMHLCITCEMQYPIQKRGGGLGSSTIFMRGGGLGSSTIFMRGGGLGSSTIFKKFHETYAPS